MVRRARKKRGPKLTEEQKKQRAEEQVEKRTASAFRRKIRNVFTGAGFLYLNTTGYHMSIGRRVVEVDAVYVYENIILICEDTISKNKSKDHIRSKNETFNEIDSNFSTFLDYLCMKYPENAYSLRRYSDDRYIRFFLYFSATELDLTNDEIAMYQRIRFLEPHNLEYFSRMTKCIKLTAKYEIFRYLGLNRNQLGDVNSGIGRNEIQAPIIYPKGTTGFKNKVRVVSFMMSAEHMLKSCYVLRKDNWEASPLLYQRLLDPNKIKSIREFLVDREEAFFSNIIVALPDDVYFIDSSGNHKKIDEIDDFEPCNIVLPHDLNSLGVIDGQHRIFAHYEGPGNDKKEEKVALLRTQLHLLITGLIFPPDMSPSERTKIQSQIFHDINDNAKKIPPDVLLHIAMTKDPYSDVGIARRVIEKLNKEYVLLNKFEMSTLDGTKIKIASIIKFALRYLVTITPAEGRTSLYSVWHGNKQAIESKNDAVLNEYIDFCVIQLRDYFSAIRKNNTNDWDNPDSKLLSVISLNGFIIAYTRQLSINGTKDFNYFDEKLSTFSMDYSNNGFAYSSSQYRKFSDKILHEAFGLDISQI